MNPQSHLGIRISTTLFLVCVIALPASLVAPLTIEHHGSISFCAGSLSVEISPAGFGPSYWTLDDPGSPLRLLPTTDAHVWTDRASFALVLLRPFEHAFDLRRFHSPGIASVGRCVIFEPSALCLTANHERTRWESEVRCGSIIRRLSLSNDAAEVGVAGDLAMLRSIDRGRSQVDIVATDPRSVHTADQIVEIVLRLEEACGGLNAVPLTLIAGCEGDNASTIGARNRFLSNLFLGPFAEQTALLRWRVAALLIAKSADAACLKHVRERAAICAAVGDLLQARVFGGGPVLEGEFAARKLVVTAANLGTTRPTWLSKLGVIPEAEERQGVEIDGPLLVAHARERSGNRLALPTNADSSQRIRAWIRETISFLQSASQPDPMPRIDELLKESSGIAPEVSTPPVECEPIRLEFSANLFGFLEDCGCKVASGGGLKRILARWSEGSDSLHVMLGDALALPGRGNFVPSLNGFVVDLLREVSASTLTAFVPGESELYAIAEGTIPPDALSALHPTACNIQSFSSGDRIFSPFVDAMTHNGRTIRLIGVCELDPSTFGRREAEIVEERFRFVNVGDAVAQIVGATDPRVPIVVCGTIDARSMLQLGSLSSRRALIFSGISRTPRASPEGRRVEQLDGTIFGTPVRFDRAFNYGVDIVAWDPARTVTVEVCNLIDPAPETALAVQRVNKFLNEDGGTEEPAVEFHDELLAMGASYVGSQRCAECHADPFSQWLTTRHAQAMKSLQAVQRHRAPGCVQCHVVGFGLPSGYEMRSDATDLRNVGCEVCHGPGSLHVDEPMDRSRIRRVPVDSLCSQCHSERHSFFLSGNQDTYRAAIRH